MQSPANRIEASIALIYLTFKKLIVRISHSPKNSRLYTIYYLPPFYSYCEISKVERKCRFQGHLQATRLSGNLNLVFPCCMYDTGLASVGFLGLLSHYFSKQKFEPDRILIS